MISQCRFEQLKIIKIKFTNLESDLLCFLIDCMKEIGSGSNRMELLEIMNLKIEGILIFNIELSKFADKLANMLSFINIRSIRL